MSPATAWTTLSLTLAYLFCLNWGIPSLVYRYWGRRRTPPWSLKLIITTMATWTLGAAAVVLLCTAVAVRPHTDTDQLAADFTGGAGLAAAWAADTAHAMRQAQRRRQRTP